ncbi:trypsin-like serine peptidase [Pararhodobacter marinus]|uniref:Serine protease n=1 Tax=Pararhodobacter marinus TaxID=2184063 RepID=A0A2U2C9X8_9RHOB|nr:trypsin-like serine protease [Pararhodobacter marinus]PWE28651.1 peptidase S1 [Pararhodobacter marinus]
MRGRHSRLSPFGLMLGAVITLAVPAALPGQALAQANTCRWANDNECDEARYGGTGACESGTDANDCRTEAAAWQRLMDAVPADIRAQLGDDTCRWGNDGECDDIRFGGTGACTPGTDASDCRAMAIGGDDSCRWANDGECDEPGIGTGVCLSGSDATDCAGLAVMRNRSNQCATAFNNVCEEPGSGQGTCRAYTDTADCIGRDRPVTMRDHYFGHDDRIMVDVTQMPWRAMGLLRMDESSCTATLIGPRLLATAAHCLQTDDGQVRKVMEFRAGASGDDDQGRAHVVRTVIAPDYDPASAPPDGGNGNDWALLELDRDLGLEVGFIRPHVFDKSDLEQIMAGDYLVSQAGYSWDTGAYPSGHMDCQILRAYRDGSMIHTCDTTRGDSGSPILHRMADGEWRLIAVDSQFFDPQPPFPQMSSSHLAVDTRSFAQALRDAGALD